MLGQRHSYILYVYCKDYQSVTENGLFSVNFCCCWESSEVPFLRENNNDDDFYFIDFSVKLKA